MKFLTFIIFFCTPILVQANIKTSIKETIYKFNADSILQMTSEVRKKGAKSNSLDTWAMLKTDIVATYGLKTTEEGCQFHDVKVDVFSEVVLPEWINIKSMSHKIQHWWIEYKEYLRSHEYNHYTIAQKHAKSLLVKMNTIHKNVTCSELKAVYLGYKYEMIANIGVEDHNFDTLSTIQLHKNKRLIEPLKKYIGTKITFNNKIGKNHLGY